MNIKQLTRRSPPPHDEPAFDINELENEIRGLVESREVALPADQAPEDYAPPTPLPAYVSPIDGISETGRLTAQVVVQQFEDTAKSLEAMGTDLIEMQRRMDQEVAAVHTVFKNLQETARLAREEGKAAFERIERMAKMTEEVRNANEAARLKLAPQ